MAIDPTAYVDPRAMVGAEPDIARPGLVKQHPVFVGAGTTIRQFVTIQRGTERPTEVGACCMVMHGAYIAHDCRIEDFVTICANVSLAGHVNVLDGVNLGMGATVHQWVTIGAYAMIGMGAVVVADVPPGVTVAGCPARIIGPNRLGLERAGIDDAQLAKLHEEWEEIRWGKRREVGLRDHTVAHLFPEPL